jgi:dynactin 1
MRDLSNTEKHENQKLTKQNEAMTTEIKQLKKDKDRLAADVSALNEQVIELQEQVDCALGAEEMVEKLTEQNLTLEEQMQELQDEKTDLVIKSECLILL